MNEHAFKLFIAQEFMKILQKKFTVYVNWSSSWVSSWHFELELRLSRVAHIFNSTQVELLIFSTWRDAIQLVKNSSLTSRELNIENFSVFDFCITFLHYLLIESHEEEHEDRLIESHKEKHEDYLIESHDEKHEEKHEEKTWRKTWRSFDRKS